MQKLILFPILYLAILFGFAPYLPAQTKENLIISAGWDGVKSCSGGIYIYYPSPVFRIKSIPAGTKFLRFSLSHVEAGIDHGTSTIPYTGGERISAGKFRYLGPCPRDYGSYQWTVEALDKTEGSILDSGYLTLTFP